jgi:hypothetical protein
MNQSAASLVRAILFSGCIVGVMDGVAASIFSFVFRGSGPAGVFRYVASGAFGKDALAGGPEMVVWGLLFHIGVPISILASRRHGR